MNWSKYQNNFYNSVQDTKSNIVLLATAGSGKTTTALECLNYIPKLKSSVFLSFSNTIVSELKDRVPPHVEASTLHSMGCRSIMSTYSGVKIYENKYFQLALDSYPKKDMKKELFIKCFNIQSICNMARVTLTPLTLDSLAQMCIYYDMEFDEEMLERTIDLIEKRRRLKHIDFADMIYIPATNPKIIDKAYDYIIIDEVQDCNKAQKEFIENLLKVSGRLISIGDPYQSIYSFMGSNTESFESFRNRPNTITLPLSVSYRCAKKIVEEARVICPTMEYAENAKEGVVREGVWEEITEGDMVICRNNAPLVTLYFNLLEREVKCYIKGKEIEKSLIDITQSCMASTEIAFINNLEKKLKFVESELLKKGVSKPFKHPRYLALLEKIEVILLILGKVIIPNKVASKIKEIFCESKEGVQLLTIHGSKGLENKRVFFITDYNGVRLIPSKYATMGWQLKQEQNLLFVALTRAKEELVYIKLVEGV